MARLNPVLPLPHGWHGATSSMTAILGRMATYSGQIVKWDEAVEKGKSLAPGMEEYTWESAAPILPNAEGIYRGAIPGVSDPFDPFAY